MANFVLSPVTPGVWTGKAKANVTVSVRSSDSNATKLDDAAYPDDTSITVNNNQSTFAIAGDQKDHTLNVGVTPPANPDNWSIVEIGADGTAQKLADFLAGVGVGAIEIKPQ
jgi:hypothetical protein